MKQVFSSDVVIASSLYVNRNSRRTGSYGEPDSDEHHDRDMTLTLETSKLCLAHPVHRGVTHLTANLYHLSILDETRYTRDVLYLFILIR